MCVFSGVYTHKMINLIGKWALVAAYVDGTVSVFPVDPTTGALGVRFKIKGQPSAGISSHKKRTTQIYLRSI